MEAGKDYSKEKHAKKHFQHAFEKKETSFLQDFHAGAQKRIAGLCPLPGRILSPENSAGRDSCSSSVHRNLVLLLSSTMQ